MCLSLRVYIWEEQTGPVSNKKPKQTFVIHGEQNTSLDVYVNEMKSKIPQNTNTSEFVCRVSRFVLSELVGTVTDIGARLPSKQTNRTQRSFACGQNIGRVAILTSVIAT